LFIKEGLSKSERLKKLNETAIEQMTILVKNNCEKIFADASRKRIK
jgi:hypothetical protein